MDHRNGAVGSQYRREIGEVICARMEAGETIASIGRDPDMPSYATIFHWRKTQPAFAAMYQASRDFLVEGRLKNRRLKYVSDAWRKPHEIKLGLRRHWVSGQRTRYDRAWAQKFCARVAAGEAVSAIVKDADMPSSKQVYSWLRRHEAFLEMYVAAKVEQRQWLEFLRDDMVAGATPGTFKAVREDVAKLEGWMGRLKPKTYGEPNAQCADAAPQSRQGRA